MAAKTANPPLLYHCLVLSVDRVFRTPVFHCNPPTNLTRTMLDAGGDRADIRPGADTAAGSAGLRHHQPPQPAGQDVARAHHSVFEDI